MMGVMCMSPVYAQTTTGARNYACDFEVDSINAKWVNNPGIYAPQIPNKWFIGDAVNNGGYSSLYISTDSARTAGYTNSSSLAVSYTTITLKEGYYDLRLIGWPWGMWQKVKIRTIQLILVKLLCMFVGCLS